MDFEWDAEKSEATLRERGFDFGFAAGIFARPTLEMLDARRAYGEIRVRAIGVTAARCLLVVYTDRQLARRIISARAANRRERALWLSLFG